MEIRQNGYRFLRTELDGVQDIAAGIVFLGAAAFSKVRQCYTGRVEEIPTDSKTLSTSQYYLDASLICLKVGCEELLPAAGVALAVYFVGSRILNSN